MRKEMPLITIYYRVLTNSTQKEIHGLTDIKYSTGLNFGIINGIDGGESPYIVEFDIWNNEPAFTGGLTTFNVADAINCRFSVWDNDNCNSSIGIIDPVTKKSLIKARCVTSGYNAPFEEIFGPKNLNSQHLNGNVNPKNKGVLTGQPGGDHLKIQTKIVVPQNTKAAIKHFVFAFEFDYV